MMDIVGGRLGSSRDQDKALRIAPKLIGSFWGANKQMEAAVTGQMLCWEGLDLAGVHQAKYFLQSIAPFLGTRLPLHLDDHSF